METTRYFPSDEGLKCRSEFEDSAPAGSEYTCLTKPGSFLAHTRTKDCPFEHLTDLRAADAEEGGLAKLFTVRLADGATVAVKRFHAARELDEALFAQHQKVAREEYERMVELDGANDHAPKAYALGSCFDNHGCEHPAIAMEFVDGFTLEYALKAGLISGTARKADKTRCIMEVGLHVSRAIASCKRVSHRDLNPRNVMLLMDRWGKVQRAVLIDFGQAITSANPLVTPSAEPHRLATVSFGAPEIYGGPFYFMRNNPSVDVYSLGTLLYYLRTRSIPFLSASTLDPTTREGAQGIVNAKRTPVNIATELGASLRDIDQGLHRIAAQCTAFDPRERPDIEDVITQLECLLNANTQAKHPQPEGSAEERPANALKPQMSPEATTAYTPEELLQIADDYFYGHGGRPRSKQQSLVHLTRAAEVGNAKAQLKLGRSLALGQHGITDVAKARHWLEQAAQAGHPGAAATLRILAA